MSASALIESLMQIHPKGFDLSLDRITGLLEKLDNPHLGIPPAIHVAGTNGKGSTIAFCRAILEAAGKTVHVDTSPHLVNWHERFRIGAQPRGSLVSDQVLADAISRVAKANDGQAITVFEILSVVAFLLFHEHPANYSLIEVGLGGRFDCTNVIKKPAVCVITPVDLDHQAFLGDTLAKIAFEKAGIIKPNSIVVCGSQHDEAYAVIEEKALECNATLIAAQRNFDCFEQHGRLVFQDDEGMLDLALPALSGTHQIDNAGLAIATIKAIEPGVENSVFEKAMHSVEWPARMQRLRSGKVVEKLGEQCQIWLDGGHNPAAGNVIATELNRQNLRNPIRTIMICGMLNTKEPVDYFTTMRGLIDEIICVPITSSDAGIDPKELAGFAQQAGLSARCVTSLDQAITQVATATKKEPARILFAGSLYLAGDVLSSNGTPPR